MNSSVPGKKQNRMRRGALLTFLLLFLFLAGCLPQPAPGQVPGITVVDTSTPAPVSPAGWWQPAVGLTWQIQLSEPEVDTSVDANVFEVDLYVAQSVIDALHAKGSRVVCYVSVGSYEDWRPDAAQFPAELLGKDYEGWPGEKWLDIRQIDKLAPILRARLDLCKTKGFDALEPDNLESYTNDTGFPLTYADQLRFALWLAEEAHARGLAIAQKNAPDQAGDLAGLYDFAVIEDAFYYDWADEMSVYIQAGKPVFAVEYTDLEWNFMDYCRASRKLGFSLILKHRELDNWLKTCP